LFVHDDQKRPATIGDEIDGWKLASISPEEVKLKGEDGEKTMRPEPNPQAAAAAPGVPKPFVPPNPARPVPPRRVMAPPPIPVPQVGIPPMSRPNRAAVATAAANQRAIAAAVGNRRINR
jgi:hypothetical protein